MANESGAPHSSSSMSPAAPASAAGKTVVNGPDDGEGPTDRVLIARQRLDDALGRLDSAVRLRIASDKSTDALERQVHHLSRDRVKLAEEIDGLKRTVRRLSSANHDVSKRLTAVMGSIEGTLEDETAAPLTNSDTDS